MSGAMTMSQELIAILQSLGGMQGAPGIGAMPQMAASVTQPGSPLMPAQGGQQFPWNASALAALGAAGMGLRAGQRQPMAAGSPNVTTRAPGGFQPVYNSLPGGRGR